MTPPEQVGARTALVELRRYLDECDDVYEQMVVPRSDDHPLPAAVAALERCSGQGRLAHPGRGHWRKACYAMDRLGRAPTDEWPHLIDAFFDALDALEGWLIELGRPGRSGRKGRSASRGNQKRRGRGKERGRLLLSAYLQHHHMGNHDALRQRELAAALGCSQPTISRWMKELFPDGAAGYVAACAADPIRHPGPKNRGGIS